MKYTKNDKTVGLIVLLFIGILLYTFVMMMYESYWKYHCFVDSQGIATVSPAFEHTCLPAAKDYN